jgi:Fe-S cluster biogenesis protein NfuA/nitrite reductase/ring-hydroxylating ferredoxin subunit
LGSPGNIEWGYRMAQARNLREVGDRIEGLLEELRSISDPSIVAKAEDLVQLLVDLYGAGLERVFEILSEQGPSGEYTMKTLAEDKFLASLLVLHGLHPVPVEVRVHEALEKVRPYLGSHAGGVKLVGIDEEGVVHLTLEGSCHGCPSSTITVKMAIERAIEEAAPEVTRVDVEGVAQPKPSPALLQVQKLPHADAPAAGPQAEPAEEAGGWVTLEGLGRLLPGEMKALETGGADVLVASAAGALYAYRNTCAACGSPLDEGLLEESQLACPRCSQRYDVRLAGRSVDGDADLHLEPLPLLEQEGKLRVAIPSGVGS